MVTVNARGSKDKDLTIYTTTLVRRLSGPWLSLRRRSRRIGAPHAESDPTGCHRCDLVQRARA
jgi:hypothetical protein